MYTLRDNLLLTDAHINSLPDYLYNEYSWQKDIPFDTRQLVFKQLAAAFKSAKKLKELGIIKKYKFKFKTKKDPCQICYLNKKAINLQKRNFFTSRLKKSQFKFKRKEERWFTKNISSIDHEFIIMKENNKWFFCIPLKPDHQAIKEKVKSTVKMEKVALDPGVRTFQTFYTPLMAGKIGDGLASKIHKIHLKEDNLKSYLDLNKTITNRTKRNIKRKILKLRTKVKDILRDYHCKTASFLTTNFEKILLPNFEVSNMIKRERRNINSKVVRMMLSLNHYAFKQRLIQKAQTSNSVVYIVNESYTSKTCGRCGKENSELRGNKIFKCSCGVREDRDYNGARNIFLKYNRL